jgi:hypothetical protein
MAHLTIRLGAPVIVPFNVPREGSGRRRERASRIHLRWRALCEARMISRERTDKRNWIRFPRIHSTATSLRQSAHGSGRDIWS